MGESRLSKSRPSLINSEPGMVVTVALLTVAALSVVAATMLNVQKQAYPTIYSKEQSAMASDLSDLCFERGSQLLAFKSKSGTLPTSTGSYVSASSPVSLRNLISVNPAGYWENGFAPNVPLDINSLTQASQRNLYQSIGLVCSYEYLGPQYDKTTAGGVKGGEISVSRDYNAAQGRERMFLIRAETVVPQVGTSLNPPYAARVSVNFHVGVN